ncbi:aryl hydrocarbon receptor-like [Heptranchias perlo]|uniref:aryl hydrocarbon receptor-like n=1 Tax=Heptranchias perlo TaxID=212740 RepID=UPI00355AA729
MLSAGGIYAMKKRKKPVQKSPKPPPIDGVKSNPSKRHRDRLNCELDKLTSLLPFSEDVRARLDKLSVLRLSVGYLKVKSFFNATMKKNKPGWLADNPANFRGNGQQNVWPNIPMFSEGDLLLEALNGFILVITAEGYVFYTSSTIQDYLGFHQSDVVHQSVFELIHTDDRPMFRRQLHWALNPPAFQESNPHADTTQENSGLCSSVVTYDPHHLPPENSTFMERNFICRFRCLLDNSSGFLTLNFQGRLRFLHGQNKKAEDGVSIPPQLALFAVATPLQPPSILEIRTKTLIFQTKHKLDFTPLACDTKGKFVLGYTEAELCMRGTGYQFIHAADMMHCADSHMRMIKTGESGMTVFRLLTKQSSWLWVQANARLVYRGGQPDSIIVRQRALTNEEGEEHFHKRAMQLPFNFATGEAVLYENNLLLSEHPDPFQVQGKGVKIKKASAGTNAMDQKNGVNPGSLLGALMTQNPSLYVSRCVSEFNLDDAFANDISVVNVPGDFWQLANNGKNSSKQEEINLDQDDPLSAIMDILSQRNGDENDLCDTLQNLDVDVENMELEQWEETLLKMDNTSVPDDLNDILTKDFILSCVEDMLTKDCPKANEFPQESLDSTEVNLMRKGQQNPFGSIQQKPFGFSTQNLAMPGYQNSITPGPQSPVVPGPQSPVVPGPQSPVVPGPQIPVVHGPQSPVVPGPQSPVVPGPQNPMVPACQNPMMFGPQNPVEPIHQTSMMFGPQNPMMPTHQTSTMSGPQDPMMPTHQTSTMFGPRNPMMPTHQTSTMSGPQDPMMPTHQTSTMFGPQGPMMPTHQTSTMSGPQDPMMPTHQTSTMFGPRNPMMPTHQTSTMSGPQDPMMPALQTSTMSGPQNPMMPTHQTSTMSGPQGPMMPTHQTSTMSGPQDPMMPALQTSMMFGPQNPMVSAAQNPPAPHAPIVSGLLQSTSMPRPQNKMQLGIQNPLGSFSENPLGMSLGNPLAPTPQSPMLCSPQKQCRSAPQKKSCTEQVNMHQMYMGKLSPLQSLQRDLQQSMLQKPQHLGLNVEMKEHSLNSPQQQVSQWQLQLLQHGQQASTQPYQVQDCLHHQMPQSSCRSTQASQDRVSTACYLDQNNSDQLRYSSNVAVQQRATVNQIQMGPSPSSSSSCMFASCEYESRAPLLRNGLSFPDSSPITALPPYSKIKVSPNHSPLQATSYYENDPVNSIVGSSVVPDGELSMYHSSCQFEPNFSPLSVAENSVCGIPTGQAPWNYNDQYKGEALN